MAREDWNGERVNITSRTCDGDACGAGCDHNKARIKHIKMSFRKYKEDFLTLPRT